MALFQIGEKQIPCEVYAGALPEDTLLFEDRWQEVLPLLKATFKNNSLTGSLAVAKDLDLNDPANLVERAENYIKLIAALGLTEVCVVGVGATAPLILQVLQSAPDLFRKVMLLSPDLVNLPAKQNFTAIKATVLLAQEPNEDVISHQRAQKLADALPEGIFLGRTGVRTNPTKLVELFCDFLYSSKSFS